MNLTLLTYSYENAEKHFYILYQMVNLHRDEAAASGMSEFPWQVFV